MYTLACIYDGQCRAQPKMKEVVWKRPLQTGAVLDCERMQVESTDHIVWIMDIDKDRRR
jgi:hypothetical protein